MKNFSSKVIIVTGASSGVGAATAILFTKEGADVAVVGRDMTKLSTVAEECAKVGKRPLVIKADVAKDNEAKTIVKQTVDTYGKLDVLVNNAGFMKYGAITSGNLLEVFDEAIATNLRAVVHITTLAAPHLLKTKGNVVNISCTAGTSRIAVPEFTPCGVSKYCLNHFSRCAAVELSPFGVRINTVTLGGVNTYTLKNRKLKYPWTDYIRHSATKKISEPEEIADLILFLASDKAKSITGANYDIDNGMKIRK